MSSVSFDDGLENFDAAPPIQPIESEASHQASSNRPEYAPFTGLPDLPALGELKSRPRWVAWKWEERNGRPTKPPVDPHTGGYARTSDPSTWGCYEQAARCAVERGLAGVGYVLGNDDGDLTGIDLDDCIHPSGKIKPWAREILDQCETYAEISPSGRGIRILAREKIDKAIKYDRAKVEIYGTGRYVTITGHKIDGATNAIYPAPRTLEALRERVEQHKQTWTALEKASKKTTQPQSNGAVYNPSTKRGELWRSIFGNDRDTFFREVNSKALANLSAWVPALLPDAAPSNQGYRVSSQALGRDLEEDLSITPQGIVDFGVHDMGDPKMGKRTPIDLVLEYGPQETAAEAAIWLSETMGVEPATLGWRGGGAEAETETEENEKNIEKYTLDEMHAVFRKWFGDEYDIDAIDAVVATAAAERLGGDPLWLLVISGPGAAKTETVQALAGAGAHVTSTIQSEGALLSATSAKARTKKATGGLLRRLGERGVLVIKDVTSILSSDRNVRGPVLAAIREIYDGKWERNVGTDGGQTLTWTGRLAIVGAVTTAWDAAHSVVAAMGDRFVLVRIDSNSGRKPAGTRAIRNTGAEDQMRQELAAAVGGVICHANQEGVTLTEGEIKQVLDAADIVTMARTAVERDYAGEIVDAHAPEMPTRFAKQLAQMIRGGCAVGMSRERAKTLALRCARDSIPPLRLEILLDVAQHPGSRPGDVRRRINKPWRTTKREMEALNMLGLLRCVEEDRVGYEGGKDKTVWRYYLADNFDRETLLAMGGGAAQQDFG